MVAAGLAGTTPHMISATITALSRLLFEFKGQPEACVGFTLAHKLCSDVLPSTLMTELISTSLVFVTSANREIVKSSLGFVKLVVTALPIPTVSPHLPELVPALLKWSHDHKNHFKVKVRHIFERMIRRFGWENVEAAAGSAEGVEEGKKVLANIKKRRDRAKRKKADKAEEEEDDDEVRVYISCNIILLTSLLSYSGGTTQDFDGRCIRGCSLWKRE
jgi:ribosomal RNA-processing protein 12